MFRRVIDRLLGILSDYTSRTTRMLSGAAGATPNAASAAAHQPVGQPRANGPHVARQAVGELAREALGRCAAVGEVAVLELGTRGEFAGARAAAAVAERRVDDDAAAARLAHGERQVATVAVEEPVALVDAAHRRQHRAAQAVADAGDLRDHLPRRGHGRDVSEAVHCRGAPGTYGAA